MKLCAVTFFSVLLSITLCAQKEENFIFNADIINFWTAYDKIVSTKDSAQQYEYLNTLFIQKGTPGLKAIMEVRNYTAQSYIDAINQYPLFWNSVRKNTMRSDQFKQEIKTELVKLKQLYPEMKPAEMYFTIGALRTNGTTFNGKVLIGSELALTDQNTISKEFPEAYAANRRRFFDSNPINDVVLLNVHEYIHTQQKEIVHNLLSECIFEGVAEFVSVKVTGKPSAVPAVAYGMTNRVEVRDRFEQEMFIPQRKNKWLWSDAPNEFNMRDMGYYIGYALCEIYYNNAKDKKAAIKYLLELDYSNEAGIEKFVDDTRFFSKPLHTLYEIFEKSRPTVLSIDQFTTGDKQVNPSLTKITLNFSRPMNKNQRGFDYGPLGESNVLRVKNVIGFSEDGKSFTFEVELKPQQRYQTLVTNNFLAEDGTPLKAFLIDIETAGK